MFRDLWASRVPATTFLVVAVALFLSPNWMPSLTRAFLASYAWTRGYSRGHQSVAVGWQEGEGWLAPQPESGRLERLEWDLRRLLRENESLKREFMTLGASRKRVGADLLFLRCELIGSLCRLDKDLWVLNMGEDFAVKEGDGLVQETRFIGHVISVAETCCLAEGTAARFSSFAVHVGDDPEIYLWKGDGEGRGRIHAPERLSEAVGRKVYLAESSSLGGGLVLGEVVGFDGAPEGGMIFLIARCALLDPGQPLFIIQPRELKTLGLFERRDELAKLRGQINEIELLKLRMELLRK